MIVITFLQDTRGKVVEVGGYRTLKEADYAAGLKPPKYPVPSCLVYPPWNFLGWTQDDYGNASRYFRMLFNKRYAGYPRFKMR